MWERRQFTCDGNTELRHRRGRGGGSGADGEGLEAGPGGVEERVQSRGGTRAALPGSQAPAQRGAAGSRGVYNCWRTD